MATISLQCNGLSEIHSSVYFKLKIPWQVEHTWEKCWHKFGWNLLRNEWVIWQTSECTKREKLPGFTQAPASPRKKCAMKMKQRKKKRRVPKIFLMEGGVFIRWLWNTHVMDIKRLQLIDSWYIEGTICLVNEWIGAKGMVFSSVGARTAP